MYKNFRRFKKQLVKEGKIEEAKEFNFFPVTFYMPNEYATFMSEVKKDPNQIWIMKPACQAQGRGIFLITNPSQIASWKASLKGGVENLVNELYIAQKYIMNPLLLGGRKFDMRIYAFVNNYNPLSIWLNRTGFARFTHARYNNNFDLVDNQYIHLTNVAVQKTCNQYDKTTGGKWHLRNLKLYLYSKFGVKAVEEIFAKIENIIKMSIFSASKIIANDRHSFELYGYDILINDNLQPVLLEINANSSLSANTPADNMLKVNMLDDMLSIIDLEKILSGNETQVGGFDLIYKGNTIKKPSYQIHKTLLGSYNNRDSQLKKLAKSTYYRLKRLQDQKITSAN